MRRRYLRALRLPGSGAAALLALAPGPGLLAAFSPADLALTVFSVNGEPLVRAEVTERLAAMAPSPCGRFLVTGGARGAATLLWLHSLEVGAGSRASELMSLVTRLGTLLPLLAAAGACDGSGSHGFEGLGHAAAYGEWQLVHPGMRPWLIPVQREHPRDSRCVCFWQGVMRYEGGCGPVTALCVTAEQCIAAGTASGALLVFAPDPRRRLTVPHDAYPATLNLPVDALDTALLLGCLNQMPMSKLTNPYILKP